MTEGEFGTKASFPALLRQKSKRAKRTLLKNDPKQINIVTEEDSRQQKKRRRYNMVFVVWLRLKLQKIYIPYLH